MRYLIVLLLAVFISLNFYGQSISQKKSYNGQRLIGEAPKLDGILSETVWENAQWENDFTQFEPHEGKASSQKTTFAILYDDNFLYVAIKAYDSNPDSIVQRMTRRDDIDGDHVAIQFDSYFDKRTAFSFLVSAAGVKGDFLMSNDGDNEDDTWNPIWWVKTHIGAKGWSAEMKIPFTQLRFAKAEEQTWGLQVARILFRKNETSLWQPMARNAGGWVSQIGTLKGLKIQPKKQFDITPYVITSVENYEAELGNPYADGQDFNLNGGVDGKIGLTNNFTLDFSINPDFGQVEADPSQVNLTAYETFFREQRPFFIEGRNILNYPLMFGDGDMASESLFYSRRIGRRPHHYPELAENEYIDIPNFTSILGAAKITGKTPDGWSIGIMESVTAEECAKISDESTERKETVEPLTNYFVARVQRDLNKGNTLIGGVVTSVNRKIDEEHLDFLHTAAYTGGIDFTQYFKEKAYYLKVNTYWGNVQGSTTAITETQLSSVRYFQRPDADYLNVDESLTSLTGTGGNIQIGKNSGNLKYMLSGSMKSPSLEVNDIGYLQSVDDIMQIFWVGYSVYEPFSIFRSARINLNQWAGWDYGGTSTYLGGNINGHAEFKNYWRLGFGVNLQGESVSNGSLRGGASIRLPGSKNLWLWLGTSNQKKFRVSGNASFNRSFEETYRKYEGFNLSFSYKPISTLSISLSPNYSNSMRELQYVYIDELQSNLETPYVFAKLEQKMVGMSIRVNYNITPELSIQYWGQPFIAAGAYSEFKYITDSHANEYSNRFSAFTENQINFDANNNEYLVDENLDGTDDYSIYNPEFNFREFLSNMVLKWEYRPGSTLYLVWSQSRSEYIENGNFDIQSDMNNLFDVEARNVFLLKFSYRIGVH